MIFVDAESGLMVLEVLGDLSHEKMEVPSYMRSIPRLSHLCVEVCLLTKIKPLIFLHLQQTYSFDDNFFPLRGDGTMSLC